MRIEIPINIQKIISIITGVLTVCVSVCTAIVSVTYFINQKFAQHTEKISVLSSQVFSMSEHEKIHDQDFKIIRDQVKETNGQVKEIKEQVNKLYAIVISKEKHAY